MTHIPEKKRSRNELEDLKRHNAFSVRPPVQQLQAQALPRVALGFCYLLVSFGAGCLLFKSKICDLLFDWFPMSSIWGLGGSYDPVIEAIYIAAVASSVIGMVISGLIFWKKPRSRHHAAILAIISLLVLVFGSVYYFI